MQRILHEETERTGTKYATAGKANKPLVNQVERILHLQVEDGIIRGARVKVTNVRKPLISVADMNDAGQDVFFHQAKAVQSTGDTGMVTTFIRNKGVFEIDAEVPPYGLGSQRHPVKVYDRRDVKPTASWHPSKYQLEISLLP